jgi:type III secretion system low calcium response chaperone LcrH/SycD
MEPFEELEEFKLSKELIEKLKDPEFLRRELAEGKSFQEIFNYTEDAMAAFYKTAYGLFQKQAYKEAGDAFFFLTNLNPYVSTYWLGLGMSEQLNNDFDSALIAYGMVSIMEPENPLAHYHSAGCYRSINDKENALASIDLAIAAADEVEAHASLKQHALSVKEALLKKK